MPSSKTNSWERYSKLRSSLDGLVMSGARTIEWANSQLQAVIDQPKPSEAPQCEPVQVKELVQFWEARFAGGGKAVMKALGEFYAPNLSFALTPPSHTLERQCAQEFFSRRVPGMRALPLNTFVVTDLDVSLGAILKDDYKERLERRLGAERWETLGRSLEESLESTLEQCFFQSFLNHARSDLGSSGALRLGEAFFSDLYDSLRITLFYATGFVVIGARDVDFRPLLRRWRSGNLPLGFDREGYVLYLCASTREPPPHRERPAVIELPLQELMLDDEEFWKEGDPED